MSLRNSLHQKGSLENEGVKVDFFLSSILGVLFIHDSKAKK